MDLTTDEVARLRSKFKEGSPDQCWIWKGGTNSGGHPSFYRTKASGAAPRASGYQVNPARVLYEIHVAPLPTVGRAYLLPTCKSRLCVNPAHMAISRSPAAVVPIGSSNPPRPAADRAKLAATALPPITALSPAVLAALDGITNHDAKAIHAEIAACESRLASLHAVLQLSLRSDRHRAEVRAPAPPAQAAVKAARPRKLVARAGLALRVASFLASTGPKTFVELAKAMTVTIDRVRDNTRSGWFIVNGDKVELTNAGRIAALEEGA